MAFKNCKNWGLVFKDKFRQAITKLGKKQTVIAKETGFTDSFISRHMISDKEPDVVLFLRKFILTYRLTPEDFYEMITEKPINVKCNSVIEDMDTIKKDARQYKKIIENLSSVLNFLSEECKKNGLELRPKKTENI